MNPRGWYAYCENCENRYETHEPQREPRCHECRGKP